MPGLVVFRRRWSVGSDDLIVPGAFLLTIHAIWLLILSISVLALHYDTTETSVELLLYYKIGYLIILLVSVIIEFAICVISVKGGILDTDARSTIHFWLYFKSIVILFDITWLVLGVVWIKKFYFLSPAIAAKEILLGLVICNWLLVLIIFITIWCTFDAAGRSWVKMKKYQRSMRESESRFNYKRSNSMNRNWRQRKVIRAYQDSWDHRCRLLFCCMSSSERNRNSFADIARLLSDFFRELDVVPSDVVAGLVLLRKFQKLEKEAIVRQKKNGTYEFLSGVPITDRTQFLALNDAKDYDFFQSVIHYMYFAEGAYGWPMYFITHRSGMCSLFPEMRCCLSRCRSHNSADVIEDNCCYCNYAALKKTLQIGDVEIIYVTYHVDIGETPFFVAIDYKQKKIIISIRGTLSMKDVLTDLNAEGEVLPLEPPKDDWLGHKGMVQAAIYIKNKLDEKGLIQKALNHNPSKNTQSFGLILVGHSLGAGTASILAILLKPQHPSLQCFSYSPPGGLLSMPAVEYSKTFITSVVVGKDVVPRIGLHQMEALRADLINAINRSVDPKWKTIACSVICCCCGPEPTSVLEMSSQDTHINEYKEQRFTARTTSAHPTDSSIALTLHQPLYPPGKIIHIVRHHPTADEQVLKKHEPVYQAIWAETTDFDEVLISPVMLQDHMPDKVLAALNKVVTTVGPRKPQRQPPNTQCSQSMNIPNLQNCINQNSCQNTTPNTSHKICLETSFTNLQNPQETSELAIGGMDSKASSVAGRSQMSSILQYDISSLADDYTGRSPSGPSEATTIILSDPNTLGFHTKLKNVAFETGASPIMNNFRPIKSPSPHPKPKSILQRQISGYQQIKKPLSLPLTEPRRFSDTEKCVDLIHDDWFGLAPLASPESLSEISSISSRASAPLSLANSIEKYLHKLTISSNGNQKLMEDIYESQLHTPKVMRRAPKFTSNLANCADDWKSIDQYKRMGQVFVTNPRVPFLNNSDSSEQSFESATNISQIKSPKRQESSKSVDNIDEKSPNKSIFQKIAFSDSAMLECLGKCPHCPCQVVLNNGGECCRKNDHSSCYINSITIIQTSSSGTYGSAMSSFVPLSSSNSNIQQSNNSQKILEKNSNQKVSGVLESHFPVNFDNTESSDKLSLLSNSPRNSLDRMRKNSNRKNFLQKRNSDNEKIFCKNESLPLLVNLSEKPSPNFVKRKSYVYPIESSRISSTQTPNSTVIKTESSV